MQLTPRDIEILYTVNNVGFISTKRIEKTFFKSYKTCIRRLNMLCQNNYLNHDKKLYNNEKIYYLANEGYKIVESLFEIETKKRKPTDKMLHYLSISDFYLAIKDKVEIDEYELEFEVIFEYEGRKYEFRPDIYLKTKDKDFFIEIDNTNRPNLIKKKIYKYEAYCKSEEYKKLFEHYPRVLFVSKIAETLKNTVEKVREIPINYYFITYDNLNKIEQNICYKAGINGRWNLWV